MHTIVCVHFKNKFENKVLQNFLYSQTYQKAEKYSFPSKKQH